VGYVDDKLGHLATTVALEAQRTREAFALGQAETKDALRVTGARATPFRPVVTSAGGRLVGWSLLAGGAATTVVFHDGADAGGDVVAVVAIPAGASATHALPAPGVSFVHGLFAEVTAGAVVAGAVWLGSVD
jgi:hypothetical protein